MRAGPGTGSGTGSGVGSGMAGGVGSGIAGGVGSGTTAGPGMGSGIGCVLMQPVLPAGTGFPTASAGKDACDPTRGGAVSEKRPDRRDPEPQRPERPPDEGERDHRDEDLKETFPSSDPPAEGGPGV